MPFSELDWEGMNPPGAMTESPKERHIQVDEEVEKRRGESDELDGDAGDIADEGTGHRG